MNQTEAAPRAPSGQYDCALQPNGVIELRRDGVTVVRMTRREHDIVADFLAGLDTNQGAS